MSVTGNLKDSSLTLKFEKEINNSSETRMISSIYEVKRQMIIINWDR